MGVLDPPSDRPVIEYVTLTPADTGSSTTGRFFGAYLSVGGTVKIRLRGGQDHEITNLQPGPNVFPFAVTRVYITGTSAVGTYYNWI